MDYYLRIQNSIDYIENNLLNDLEVTEIASQACFSPYHYQRIFQAVLGYSVKQYIRLRRLSESALELANSDPSIIDLAIKYSYNSQEAYTRSFKTAFGLTPGSVRKSETQDLALTKRVDLNSGILQASNEKTVDKPSIIEMEPTKIVGYAYRTHLEDRKYFEDISGFYDDFGRNEYFKEIPESLYPAFPYGVVNDYKNDGSFGFFIGEEVPLDSVNHCKKLTEFKIEQGKYAEFKVSGNINEVRATWLYIYGTWLLNSNYELRSAPDFEIMDVANSMYPDNIKISIFIPIV